MRPMEEVPFGRRVQVTTPVVLPRDFGLPHKTVPAGSCGVVDTGRVGTSIFLFEQECPVMFDNWVELRLAEVEGIPWEFLEFAESPSS